MKRSLVLVLCIVCAFCAVGFAACSGNGTGVKKATINDNGELIITLTDDEEINAGKIDAYHDQQGLAFYPLPDGTYCVEAGQAKYAEEIAVPSVFNGKAVTAIGDGAFSRCTNLKNIVIPDSVKIVDEGAFYRCDKLTSVIIPDSVLEIRDGAFEYCVGLTEVDLGSGVKYLGNGAFRYCSALTSVIIPSAVTSLGLSVFVGCSSLENVAFGENSQLTEIKDGAFSLCGKLTGIAIPACVTSIGEGVFNKCIALQSISFDGTVEKWNSISKGDRWSFGVPATAVQCTDGTAKI
ncbi:MAG: leucine-rich repeat domain-containing protein [Clostridia bacterium]|nr:leucine-rich repeat domain-containing protein [Clostridia bacterium]